MIERSGKLAIALFLSSTLLACGGSNETAPGAGGSAGTAGAGGGSSGSGGDASGGSASGGSSGSTGSGGSSGSSGSGGSGGGSPLGCAGPFGNPVPLFVDGDRNPQSLSPTADELELFYVQRDAVDARYLVVRTRNSRDEPFGEPVEIPELIGVCGTLILGSLDVSENGLRLYVGCESEIDFDNRVTGTVLLAERPSRGAPFVVSPTPLATTGISVGISADELTLYSSTGPLESLVATQHRRSSLSEPFGEPEPVPGLTGVFRNVEPSVDGLAVYGAIPEALGARLVVTTRATTAEPFGALITDGLPVPPEGATDASPAISADCRTLYFLRVEPPSASTAPWVVYTARR